MVHASLHGLDKRLGSARKKVMVGEIYFHYKSPDRYYVVEFVGILESSDEVCVGYRALYGKGVLWVRTLENFLEKVDGKLRFEKI